MILCCDALFGLEGYLTKLGIGMMASPFPGPLCDSGPLIPHQLTKLQVTA